MSVTTRRRLSDEERAERRRADREYTRQAAEQLRSSEGWQRWLASRRHFHGYSLANQLLIAMARPTATRVAGFRKWLELGYAVDRGERAIKIWAPCPPSRKQLERWKREGADPDARPRTYFKLVPVFAQDQVSPLPPPAEPAPLEPPIHELEGEDLADVIPMLDALAGEIGCTVQERALPGSAHGCYEPDTGRITIDAGLSANARVKTRCHELAHALIRRERQDGDPELDYAGGRAGGRVDRVHVRRGARDPQRRLLGSVPRLLGRGLGPGRARANRRADRPAGLTDRERRPLARVATPLQKQLGTRGWGARCWCRISPLSGSGAGNP